MFDQNAPIKGLTFFQSSQVDPSTLIYCVIGLMLFIGLLVYGTYRYQQFKQMRLFVQEMGQLGLNSDEESMLTQLVKQHAMHEPVKVLLSIKAFDEMAEREINRVLASAGSTTAKGSFIQLVYEIRKKTYFPEWNAPKHDEGVEMELDSALGEQMLMDNDEKSIDKKSNANSMKVLI